MRSPMRRSSGLYLSAACAAICITGGIAAFALAHVRPASPITVLMVLVAVATVTGLAAMMVPPPSATAPGSSGGRRASGFPLRPDWLPMPMRWTTNDELPVKCTTFGDYMITAYGRMRAFEPTTASTNPTISYRGWPRLYLSFSCAVICMAGGIAAFGPAHVRLASPIMVLTVLAAVVIGLATVMVPASSVAAPTSSGRQRRSGVPLRLDWFPRPMHWTTNGEPPVKHTTFGYNMITAYRRMRAFRPMTIFANTTTSYRGSPRLYLSFSCAVICITGGIAAFAFAHVRPAPPFTVLTVLVAVAAVTGLAIVMLPASSVAAPGSSGRQRRSGVPLRPDRLPWPMHGGAKGKALAKYTPFGYYMITAYRRMRAFRPTTVSANTTTRYRGSASPLPKNFAFKC